MYFLVSNWWPIMHVSSPHNGQLHWALAWSLCPGAGPFVYSGTKQSSQLMGISVSEHGHSQIWFNNWLYYNEWPRQNGPWALCPHTTKLFFLGGYIGFTPSVRPLVRQSICPSCTSCQLCNSYISGWILSIFGANDHWHEGVCSAQWPLTLTYTLRVVQPWICNKTTKIWHILSCPLYSMYSSG